MAPRTRTHARSQSAPRVSIASSSSSIYEDCLPIPDESTVRRRAGPGPRRVAIVGCGREALALSPSCADEFTHNLSLAVCSSPELTIPSTYPPPNPNPGPVLRRIASEAPHKRASRLSQLPPVSAPRSKGLPPPPRPQRRRPPPVFVSTLGSPLALVEQSYSPFVSPSARSAAPRSSSVPPSAVSSSFWGCSGPDSSDSSDDLDVDALDAVYDEYEFSEGELDVGVEADEHGGVKSALGGTYFPPTLEGGSYRPSSPASMSPPRTRRGRVASPLGVRRPLRVQVSVERVAFRDGSPQTHEDDGRRAVFLGLGRGVGIAQGLPGLEDGIKTREHEYVREEVVHGLGGQRATKVSLGKALGRWLKKRT